MKLARRLLLRKSFAIFLFVSFASYVLFIRCSYVLPCTSLLSAWRFLGYNSVIPIYPSQSE